MDNQLEWNNIRSQLDKDLKNIQPKNRFAINNDIMNQAKKIMTTKSLSLIYDEYGNQIYEKTSDIQNYIQCKKSGSSFLLLKDDSKLVETKTQNDSFNTDFISYDSLPDIHKNNVKYDMDIDSSFKKNNDYLYIEQEKKQRKDRVFSQGIREIKTYINTIGQEKFKKIDANFSTFIK